MKPFVSNDGFVTGSSGAAAAPTRYGASGGARSAWGQPSGRERRAAPSTAWTIHPSATAPGFGEGDDAAAEARRRSSAHRAPRAWRAGRSTSASITGVRRLEVVAQAAVAADHQPPAAAEVAGARAPRRSRGRAGSR